MNYIQLKGRKDAIRERQRIIKMEVLSIENRISDLQKSKQELLNRYCSLNDEVQEIADKMLELEFEAIKNSK